MRPIGYWAKELDRRLEAEFERRLGGAGVTRRQWQVLNVLPAPADEVDREMAPFLSSAAELLDGLVDRGWARRGEVVELTGAGFAAREAIGAEVAGLRAKAADGIGDADYLVAVRTLERMVANLE
ncbi:MarR family transcriptional regulator [Actinokineospora auranticolor]|uniref:DNA-binding MarR family transcriptional regulator n=1 Tax=Actinokineospora auranticolor TaxID=155976 RepID=A0A2S6GSA6_9PSEU|nr:MarR family transcriptional regulator [Actinokineospora auranticolor]PPK68053.1 hypothetical protein CLV40_106286 [Actinokineospora auranticolor]